MGDLFTTNSFVLRNQIILACQSAIVDQELWLLFMCNRGFESTIGLGEVLNVKKFKCKGNVIKPVSQYFHKCTKCNGDHSFTKCVSNRRNAYFRSGVNGGGFRQTSKPGMPQSLLQ